VIKLYTHVHDPASQTAMQRLADADGQQQPRKETQRDPGSESAQIKHTGRGAEQGGGGK